jgi:GDP-L-fucose synthase
MLITGGTGFVGRHLAKELRRRGIEHAALSQRDYDLTRPEQAEAALAAHAQCNVIVHLASYQAAGEFPAKHPGEQFHINTLIHANLLEAWRRHMPHAKLLAVGCSCAYPSGAEVLSEDRLLDGPIHGSVYSFAHTKRSLYVGLRAYNDQYGLDGSYVIPATLYGEDDDFAPETSHVCGALVARFVRAVRESWPEVEIWGDGTQKREFMDVKDFPPA